MFKALLVQKNDEEKISINFAELNNEDLPEGDVLIDVEYSTVNYKDGLAITNTLPIVRSWPMVPGIDLAGSVVESSLDDLPIGSSVVVNGWGLGENHWGGYSQRARVQGDWPVVIPENFSTQQAMAIGTAGFTAMLCIIALEENEILPDSGPVLVTGAAGGVGSVAVSILSDLGYEVHASTGRSQEASYLAELGAHSVIDRAEFSEPSNRPLNRARWAGAIDTVGSHTLANVLTTVLDEGCVAACGNAQGMDLPSTVAPFILRGVTLRGVHSVTVPKPKRVVAWDRLGKNLNIDKLSKMTKTIGLEEVPGTCNAILDGQIRGRVVVDVNK
tara:strand:+ start:178 stop:1167 length:990 start_codon:yes stop_codon:yes gene_type:complete